MIINFSNIGTGGGGGSVDIIDNLSSTRADAALSAKQGKVLNEGKQETLVSGTNIKTINTNSILGSGDIQIVVPTKLSDLTNDEGFITKIVNDLTNYYLKSEVDAMVTAIPKFKIQVVDELPATGDTATVYLVRNAEVTGSSLYEEWIYVNTGTTEAPAYRWEKLGTATIDLSNYYNKTQVDTLLNEKQDTINDLSTIRSGAALGATSVQPSTLNNYYTSGETNTAISTAVSGKVGSTSITTIWKGTQAEYDAISTKDNNTFYIIV